MNYEVLKKNFENHRFLTSHFQTKEEAADYLEDRIQGECVAFGGCMTAKEMGLYERLQKKNEVLWHWATPAQETRMKARDASVYILSANGVSETGELVNIDGTGNRLSTCLFGPKNVYYLVGRNKIAPDLHSALTRAKNVAAPKNMMRLDSKTPCVANGGDRCYDCNSPDRGCSATLILERPCRGMDVEVVFIEEELGF